MDAGKINSLVHSLRANVGGSQAGPSQGDAAFAAKIAAVVVLDDLLHASEGDPQTSPGLVVPLPLAPRTGVIVNLSSGVVAAEMAARLGSALPRPGEALQPSAPASSAPAAGPVYSLTERLGDSARAGVVASGPAPSVVADDRRGPSLAPAAPPPVQIEARSDVYPFMPLAMMPSSQAPTIEQRNGVAAAIAQARDSERLAGLHVKGATEVEVAPRSLTFERIVLGALALGVLVVLFV